MIYTLALTGTSMDQSETVTAASNAYLLPISEAAAPPNDADFRKEQRLHKRRMDTALNTLRKKLQKTENAELWFDGNLLKTMENAYIAQSTLFQSRDIFRSNAQES